MNTTHNENFPYLRERLLDALNRIRHARNHDETTAEFYYLLGLVSAANVLGAIDIEASSNLRDLALNASKTRADELTATSHAIRLEAKQKVAA